MVCNSAVHWICNFFIAGIAETHRLPFDIPEAESELIAGFHSEYSGMKFGMFFVGEYLGITLISSITVCLFFGGWLGPDFLPPLVWFVLKTFAFICLFILLRASLPRPTIRSVDGIWMENIAAIDIDQSDGNGGIVLMKEAS